MAENSYFWGGTTVGDHGVYTDDNFSDFIRYLLQRDRTSEGILDSGNKLAPTNPSGVTISINTGYALVDGKLYVSTGAVTHTVSAPGSGSNYYTVVLSKDFSAQTVRQVLLGPSVSAFPAVTQNDGVKWEIAIAHVKVTSASVVTVTDVRTFCQFPTIVTSDMIEDDAITTTKILDGAVTQSKLTLSPYIHAVCGRLTLQSGYPIQSADQSGKSTLYFTPYLGNTIQLFTSGAWVDIEFAETSLDISNATNFPSGFNFDIFAYNNTGTLVLEALKWSNDSTRATALTTEDGVYVKTGDATRRYLGTIRTSAAGQCTDSSITRYVWNMYNRVNLGMNDGRTSSHSYEGAARKWNNSDTNNLLRWVNGLPTSVQLTLSAAMNAEVGTSNYTYTLLYVDGASVGNILTRVDTQWHTGAIGFCPHLVDGYHYAQVYEQSASGPGGFINFWMSAFGEF